MGIETRAHGRATQSQFIKFGQNCFDPRHGRIQLGDITGKFLP